MSGIIKALAESGNLLRYIDFRTGSYRDLMGTPTSISGTPAWSTTKHGLSFLTKNATSTSISISPSGLQPSASGLLTLCLFTNMRSLTVGTYIFQLSTGQRIQQYISGNQLLAYNGTIISSSSIGFNAASRGCRTIGANFGGSAVSDAFVDGLRYAGTSVLTFTADPAAVNLGYSMPRDDVGFQAWLALDLNGVTDADIARLHRELVVAPGVVRRARTAFSIPHPIKSPVEYAAESITLDSSLIPISGRMPVFTGSEGAVTGNPLDVTKQGPFDLAVRPGNDVYVNFGNSQGNPVPGTGSFACSTWFFIERAAADTSRIISKFAAYPLWALSIRSTGQFSARVGLNAGANVETVSTTIPTQKWTHIVFQVDRSANRLRAYLDGVSIINTDISVIGASSLSNTNDLTVLKHPTSGVSIPSRFSGFTFYNRRLSDEEIRTKYLEGARKCTLDAWVHSDGSCPVSLGDRLSGDVADGWKITRGSVRVVEDAASVLKPGARWIQRITNCTVARRSTSAFGSWYVRARTNVTSGLDVMLVASNEREYAFGSNNGYLLELFTTGVYLFRVTASAPTVIFASTGILQAATDYEFWITRGSTGVWTLWIKGGAFSTWTLMTATSGSNPVTDLTHVTSKYCSFAGVSTHEFGGLRTFLGEMTPDEAIAAGVLDLS